MSEPNAEKIRARTLVRIRGENLSIEPVSNCLNRVYGVTSDPTWTQEFLFFQRW